VSAPIENVDNRVATLRRELADTLDAIEDKLNVPKQSRRLLAKAWASYEDRPVPWILGAATAVIVVGGLIAWAIFRDD
jgi:hypothetical protein